MKMKRALSYGKFKWLNLVGFTLLYNTVYIARFNLNNFMDDFSADLEFSEMQELLLSSSVYLSYAIGSFINGRIVDGRNPKNAIALGAIVSILANFFVAFAHGWTEILVLWVINGYFQSMIWIAGMCLIVRFWTSRERGLACGLANFASGMSHVTAYVLPIALGMLFPYLSWRSVFVIPMGVVAVFLILFWLISTDDPSSVELEAYHEENRLVKEREQHLSNEVFAKHGNPWRYFFTRPKFLWWCAIALLSSLCRYGLLNWIPKYYSRTGQGEYLTNPFFIDLILPVGMAFGALLVTWITVKKFLLNKSIMVVCCAAMCGSLMLIFPLMSSIGGILSGVFCTGFFLYGINGILWIYAMDRGGRVYTGTVVGILNCCAYLGAALESLVFPLVLSLSGDMIYIFIVMEVVCMGMVICGMVVSERDTEIEEEIDDR